PVPGWGRILPARGVRDPFARPHPPPTSGRCYDTGARHANLDQPGLTMLEEALRRDRIVTAAGIVVLAALAWAYVLSAAAPSAHAGMTMTMAMPGLAWLVGMWFVMMVAMMLPSAAPTILL